MSRTLRGEIWGLSFAATHSALIEILGVQSRLKGVNYLLKYDLYYSEILSSK